MTAIEECQNIARYLRDLVYENMPNDIGDAAVLKILGIGDGLETGTSCSTNVLHLAEIIDRPIDAFVCLYCGHQVIERGMNYCPSCGAEVIG